MNITKKPFNPVAKFFSASVLCLTVLSASATPIVLETPQGKLQGELVGRDATIATFKAIPYALPPIGVRRWRAAEPATQWEGVRAANNYSPTCTQMPYPENSFFASVNLPTSEDCLYLNVWGQQSFAEKKPVMVWIHGGALTRGSGANPNYDGTHLAEKGVVVVTINYRLDIFGHFAHPELSRESTRGVSGNYATTDQLEALRWVKNNISAFGGDANNVTIFGASAGSWSVNQLVATPLAKGLFHKAIGQSGAVLDVMRDLKKSVVNMPSAESIGTDFAKASGAKNLAGLRALPAEQLLSLSAKQRFSSRAVVDGWIFPEQIYSIMNKGKQNAVPVLLGFNADEATTLGGYAMVSSSKEEYIATIKKRYGESAERYLKIYPADDLTRSTLNAFRDNFVTWSMQSWAMMTDKIKQPAYLYYFSHRPSGAEQKKLGAYHAAEIRYVFDNVVAEIPYEQKMAAIMSDYWVAFASTGNPNGVIEGNLKTDAEKSGGLPKWLAYKKEGRAYMEFNAEKKAGAIPQKELHQGIWEFYEDWNKKNRPN